MIKLAILGCTGSIGKSTLNVVRRHSELFRIVFLANGRDTSGLLSLAKEFSVNNYFSAVGLSVKCGKEVSFNPNMLAESETYSDADIVVNGIVGLEGLGPTVAVLKANKVLATANKESIVCAGNLINNIRLKTKSDLRPLDSEHSTVWQCIGENQKPSRIILTASGGAFRDFDEARLNSAKAADALRHPNWVMGPKVTVDCATLTNKGMEIIEAKRLFCVENVEAVLHRESIIHALVEMEDGALLAGMSNPDMEIPIQYALTYPKRIGTDVKKLKVEELGALTFGRIDEKRFPCFGLWKEAAGYGDYAATVLNAANEIAVKFFLEDRLNFYGIAHCAEKALLKFGLSGNIESINDVLCIDKEVREYTLRSISENKC